MTPEERAIKLERLRRLEEQAEALQSRVPGARKPPVEPRRETLASRQTVSNYVDAAKQAVQRDLDAVAEVGSGLLLDWDDELAGAIVAPFRAIASQFGDEPMGLGEAYRATQQQADAAKDARRKRNAVSTSLGYGVGAVGTGAAVAGRAGAAWAPAAASGLRTMVGRGIDTARRLLHTGATGAVEGGIQAYGDDNDPMGGMAVGGALGAGGQYAGEIVGRLAHRGFERLGIRGFDTALPGASEAERDMTEAARLLHERAAPAARTLDTDRLIATREAFGDDAMVLDLDENLRTVFGSTVRRGMSPETAGMAADAAGSRDVREMASQAFDTALGPTVSRAQRSELHQMRRDDLQQEFQRVQRDMDMSGVTINPEVIAREVREIFSHTPGRGDPGITRMTSQQAAAARSVMQQLQNLGAIAPGSSNDPFNFEVVENLAPSTVIKFKQGLDSMIARDPSTGMPTVDKETRKNLIQLKNRVNDGLKSIWPEYASVNQAYADDFALQAARTEGEFAFRDAYKSSIEDVQHFYQNLTEGEQAAFREGLAYSLIARADKTGRMAALLQVAGPDAGDLDIDMIGKIFGDRTARELAQAAEKVAQYGATAATVSDAQRGVIDRGVGGEDEARAAQRTFDWITGAALTATGKVYSSAGFTTGRSLAIGSDRQAGSRARDVLAQQLTRQGEDADAALAQLSNYFRAPPAQQRAPFLLNFGALTGLMQDEQ